MKKEAIEILQQSDTREVVASEVEVTLKTYQMKKKLIERLKDMKNIDQWKWVSRL